MRNTILMELIDKMHSQMADKAYPAEKLPGIDENDMKGMPPMIEDGEVTPEELTGTEDEEDPEIMKALMRQRDSE